MEADLPHTMSPDCSSSTNPARLPERERGQPTGFLTSDIKWVQFTQVQIRLLNFAGISGAKSGGTSADRLDLDTPAPRSSPDCGKEKRVYSFSHKIFFSHLDFVSSNRSIYPTILEATKNNKQTKLVSQNKSRPHPCPLFPLHPLPFPHRFAPGGEEILFRQKVILQHQPNKLYTCHIHTSSIPLLRLLTLLHTQNPTTPRSVKQ